MAEEFDTGFELLPEEEAEITPDEELELLLAPTDVASEGEDIEEPPMPLGRGWPFDFQTGQFGRAGFAPAATSGVDHLRTWIEKTLRTARFAHPIYTDDYGTEWPEPLIGAPFTPALAGKVSNAVEDALLQHDRITQVKDFFFEGGPESDLLAISFTVVLDDEELSLENVPIARAVT